MRPQLNIPLDGNPELLEKLRKFCKVRGYRISDYCIRILDAAIDKEISKFANNETIEPSDERIKKLEVSVEELRSRLELLDSQKLSESRYLAENLATTVTGIPVTDNHAGYSVSLKNLRHEKTPTLR